MTHVTLTVMLTMRSAIWVRLMGSSASLILITLPNCSLGMIHLIVSNEWQKWCSTPSNSSSPESWSSPPSDEYMFIALLEVAKCAETQLSLTHCRDWISYRCHLRVRSFARGSPSCRLNSLVATIWLDSQLSDNSLPSVTDRRCPLEVWHLHCEIYVRSCSEPRAVLASPSLVGVVSLTVWQPFREENTVFLFLIISEMILVWR